MGGGAFTGNNNGNGAMHARGPSNGEDFSDFQGSSSSAPAASATGAATTAGGGGGGGGGATNGGAVTNPKWRDVSSLVDLGGLSSNTEKKVG